MENTFQITENKMRPGLIFEHEANYLGGYNLILKYKGEEVGSCGLYPTKSGIADYLLDNFIVEDEFRRNSIKNKNHEEYFGFGSDLIECVNYFIKSIGKSAYLINGTEKDFDQFYQRHGWVEFLEGSNGVLVFNKKVCNKNI